MLPEKINYCAKNPANPVTRITKCVTDCIHLGVSVRSVKRSNTAVAISAGVGFKFKFMDLDVIMQDL